MLRVFRIEVEKFESELLLLDLSDKGPGFGCTLPDRIKRRTVNHAKSKEVVKKKERFS